MKRSLTSIFLTLIVLAFLLPTMHDLVEGLPRAWWYLSKLGTLDVSRARQLGRAALDTMWMSVGGSTLAMLAALPLAYLACRDTTPHLVVYHLSRVFLTFLRGIPMVVLGILFVVTVGLGKTAGVLALWVHTTGVLAKYLSEYIETSDRSIIDAAQIDGANRWQLFRHILLPVQLSLAYGLLLYYYEANFRSATVLGMVGAGGIGLELVTSVSLFAYGRITFIVLVIVAVSYALDQGSRFIRKRYL